MKDIALVNLKTGEILEDKVLIIGKNPLYLDKGYVKVFTVFLKDVVENKDIAGKAIRLLLYMLSNLDYNSYEIKIIPKKAIQELRIKKMTYHRWINSLIKADILQKIDTYTYKLNPYIAVKGSSYKTQKNEIEKVKT